MAAKETDPLLPNDRHAPEISYTQLPESNGTEILCRDEDPEEAWEDIKEERRPEPEVDYSTTVSLVKIAIFICFIFMLVVTDWRALWEDLFPRSLTLDQRVTKILSNTPLIDGHNDLAIVIRLLHNNQIYNSNFTKPFENGGMAGHVDIPRLKEGQNGGAFWSAYVPCPKDGMDWSDENYAESVAFTLSQIDVINRLQALYPTVFSPPPNSSTALPAFKSGQLISPLGIEGLHQIGNSLSNLRHYYSLGVRYATLTHNCHNKYADAALLDLPGGGSKKAEPFHGGLSEAGYELIHEMNRIGMIVDISHVSQDTMRDVLTNGSAAPVIFSHSSAYALCPHPRNVPDSILQLVKKRNSVVMINFAPTFVSCIASDNPDGIPDFYEKNSTLEFVVDHIKYVGDLIGYDYVGLGSDFDGIPSTPRGLEDVSKYPALVKELLRRGVSDGDAEKVVGGNVLRVWKDVDDVAAEMKKKGVKPVEDKLPDLIRDESFLPVV